MDFESAEDLEKTLALTGLKVFGNEIKLEKPKGKDSKKDRDARTLLDKNLPCKVTQDDLKEVFEDAVEIRLVSKDGKSKGIACIEFKTEADEEKNLGGKAGNRDRWAIHFLCPTPERKVKVKTIEMERITFGVVNQKPWF